MIKTGKARISQLVGVEKISPKDDDSTRENLTSTLLSNTRKRNFNSLVHFTFNRTLKQFNSQNHMYHKTFQTNFVFFSDMKLTLAITRNAVEIYISKH